MRSFNPVLANSATFTNSNQQNQTIYPTGQLAGDQRFYSGDSQQLYGSPSTAQMTIDSVIFKTALTLGTVVLVAGLVMSFVHRTGLQLVFGGFIISALMALVLAFVIGRARQANPALIMVYAVCEGVFLGCISAVFDLVYPGVIGQAVVATVVAAIVIVASYHFFNVRLTSRAQKILPIAVMVYAAVLLVNFLLSLFNVRLGLTPISFTWLGMGCALIGATLALFSFLSDIQTIDNAIKSGAPEQESWRAAFALTVTLVWLYVEILRILSYLRD